MSSDEGSINSDPVVSDNEQNNEILEMGEDQAQTEEVQRDGTEEGGENEDAEKTIVKPKRAVRNPQPKLNEETLKGLRGIAALESYFQRVKFKGKGQEQQDLEVIMKTYEYWCHRLFPKFPFDTCIERLEKLGSKKAVQTHVKRIRFDLLIEDRPILDDSDEEPNVEGFVDIQNHQINQQQNQQFDQLLGSSALPPNTTSLDLTEDQLERIKLNKEKAERLRQERLKKIRDKAEESLQVSSQLLGTSGLRDEIGSESSEALVSTQHDILTRKDSSDHVEDQLERIKLNKEKAERLRQEKLKKIRDKAEESLQVSSQLPGTSGLRDEIGSESSEALVSTQYDILTRKDSSDHVETVDAGDVLDEIDDADTIFDHESNIKGKTNVNGASIKKRPVIFNSDSDRSDDDNSEGKVHHEHESSQKRGSDHIDIDQNSESGFPPKKKNKRNTIYDSDNTSEDEKSAEKNISSKRLIDSDDSDQEMDQGSQSPKGIKNTKKSREIIPESDTIETDQEVDLMVQ